MEFGHGNGRDSTPEIDGVDVPVILSDDDIALRALRQAALAANFCESVTPYLSGGSEEEKLRPHQPGVFGDLHQFFTDNRTKHPHAASAQCG